MIRELLPDRFGLVRNTGPGQPPLPTRLMAGLMILKHTFTTSSDEALCACWLENPARLNNRYWGLFTDDYKFSEKW